MAKYPNCEVPLIGEDSHSLAIVSRVQGELGAYLAEALAGDGNHVVKTCERWVTVL